MRICNNSRLRFKLKQKNVQASRLVIVLIILFNAFDFFYLHVNYIDNLFFYANARGRSISHHTRLMHITWGHNTFILQ